MRTEVLQDLVFEWKILTERNRRDLGEIVVDGWDTPKVNHLPDGITQHVAIHGRATARVGSQQTTPAGR